MIGSQRCDFFTNRTMFCSKSHLFLSQWELDSKTTNQILRLFQTNQSHCRKMKDKKGIVWQIKLCDFKMDVIKWQLNFRRVELFWAEIILVISNRTRSLWKHTYDFRPICTPLSSITIIYYIDTSVLLENIPLVKFIKTTSGTRVVYFP